MRLDELIECLAWRDDPVPPHAPTALVEDISFTASEGSGETIRITASERSGETIRITAEDVRTRVGELAKNADLTKFIL